MTSSKRHHYIPQFYLNGFTNNDGEYFVFDKQTETIRKSKPVNSFFENNRNTVMLGNEKTVFLEDMYAHFDSITAQQIEKIRLATIDNFKLDPIVLARMKVFISQIYWRIPENDEELEKQIDELTFEDIGLDFVNEITGESLATLEFQKHIKEAEVFRQMYRLFIPWISAQKRYQNTDYDNWRVYFHKDKLHLTGDNPIVFEKYIDYSSLTKELIFPIASDKLLVHTKRNKPQSLPPLFLVELDMLILQQATRFVCCADRKYLEFLINKLYPFSKGQDFIEEMKRNVFGYFK